MILSGFVMLVMSCRQQPTGKFGVLDRVMGKAFPEDVLAQARYCVIVPRSGCGGCIDNAIQYLNTKMDSLKGVYVVVTGIVDRKLLRLELGEAFLERKNVYLDTARLFQELELLSSYPQVVTLALGKATDVKELDVYSTDMNKLLGRAD
jgi:hypothetical protein